MSAPYILMRSSYELPVCLVLVSDSKDIFWRIFLRVWFWIWTTEASGVLVLPLVQCTKSMAQYREGTEWEWEKSWVAEWRGGSVGWTLFTCQLALINLVFGEIAQRLEHLPAAVAAVQRRLVVLLLSLLSLLWREQPLPQTPSLSILRWPLEGALWICKATGNDSTT